MPTSSPSSSSPSQHTVCPPPRSSLPSQQLHLGTLFVCLDYPIPSAISTAPTTPRTPVRDQIFSNLWLRLQSTLFANELSTALPGLVAQASGTILEIGPGSGNQLCRYNKEKVERIYGVEPNAGLHAALREEVKKCGLSDVYTLLECGIENGEMLARYGVEADSVDTVLSVQVLWFVASLLHQILPYPEFNLVSGLGGIAADCAVSQSLFWFRHGWTLSRTYSSALTCCADSKRH